MACFTQCLSPGRSEFELSIEICVGEVERRKSLEGGSNGYADRRTGFVGVLSAPNLQIPVVYSDSEPVLPSKGLNPSNPYLSNISINLRLNNWCFGDLHDQIAIDPRHSYQSCPTPSPHQESPERITCSATGFSSSATALYLDIAPLQNSPKPPTPSCLVPAFQAS